MHCIHSYSHHHLTPRIWSLSRHKESNRLEGFLLISIGAMVEARTGWGQSPGTCLSIVAPESQCGILRFENHFFKALVLKLLSASESPGDLVKTVCQVPPSSSSVA